MRCCVSQNGTKKSFNQEYWKDGSLLFINVGLRAMAKRVETYIVYRV